MITKAKIPWQEVGIALLLYATVLVYQGYQYGQGDQSQILPCLYAQDHPGAYAADHYVSTYLLGKVNERSVFHFIFRYLGYNQPWLVWIWHVILGTSLMLAWIRIAGLGIRLKAYQYLAAASIFIIGYHTSTGSNELYYNMVIPSLAAKALGSWAIYYWLKEKYLWWISLVTIAGFLQPLVGLQLFMLTLLAMAFHLLLEKKIKELPWKLILPYLILTLPWLYFLAKYNGGSTSPDLFMDIMEFRLSHHFFPSYFGWFHLIVFGLFAIITIRFYTRRLKWFMLAIVIGCIAYTIGVENYRSPLALYTQWWKTTIWLEAFLFIAVMVNIEKFAPSPKLIAKYSIVVPILLLLLISTYRLSGWFGEKPEYMFPWSSVKSDAVDVSEQAATLTPENSVFIIPIDFTAFRWYSKRSLYVDYKALFHQEQFLFDWYKRIENIYAYGLKEKKGGFDIHVFSTALLEEPTLISTDYWRSLGITHIISTSADIKTLKLVYSNPTYTIYSLY